MKQFSPRAQAVYRRTYSRVKDNGTYETWEETIDRVCRHQHDLWVRAKGDSLATNEMEELLSLKELLLSRRGSLSGRTLWLGGTEVSRRREACQFNCSFLKVQSICDVVDAFWLLLQGCGVGFRTSVGLLNGFSSRIDDVEYIRSTRTNKGQPNNVEEVFKDRWYIRVGDSAEAWAKFIGKLLAGKHPRCSKLVIDFSEIRPAGSRLSGYGWISSGDADLHRATMKIVEIMNNRADSLLTHMDIHDIMTLLGTVLSSRRSAEISLFPYGIDGWKEFSSCKSDLGATPWRAQSNNSLLFFTKPTFEQSGEVLDIMYRSGGSEPGIINAGQALIRAPWFSGANPCVEILLPNRGFCNLVEYNLSSTDSPDQVLQDLFLLARANYRQTCVNLKDGILQESWHQTNEFLRLCGVSITGIHKMDDVHNFMLPAYRKMARRGADSMADSLNLPRSKNVTCIKPSGTLSKIMDTTEGVHSPIGRYVFNNVMFSNDDPILKDLKDAGYRSFPHPSQPSSTVVTFPEDYGGSLVNEESAVSQLERYAMFMEEWCDQNVSCTISYRDNELGDIHRWLYNNWDRYVGVSFIKRMDPTLTAKDLGYAYLPQEVVTKEAYEEYTATLKPVTYSALGSTSELENDCAGGVCPIR